MSQTTPVVAPGGKAPAFGALSTKLSLYGVSAFKSSAAGRTSVTRATFMPA